MKWTKTLGLASLLLLPAVVWASAVGAQSMRSGDHTIVATDEVVDSTLYAAGRSVDIAGEVRGDIFCAGQTVTISGKVWGDVICGAQTVHISGDVMGDVRVAGQNVTIGGDVHGNLTSGAQSFTLETTGKVQGDASLGSTDVALYGTIGRDVTLGSTSMVLTGSIGRNLKAGVEQLRLNQQARIGGTLEYTSQNDATIAEGAQIVGQTTRHKPAQKENKGNYGKVFAFSFGMAFYVITSLLAVALVLVVLFPHAFHTATSVAHNNPLKTLLIGVGASFAMPVLIIGLMVTVVGIPLALLLMLSWLLILFLAGPFFSYYLGRLVSREQRNPVIIMLIGALLVLLAYFVPILGFITFMAVVWMGTGIVLRGLFNRTPKPSYDLSASKK